MQWLESLLLIVGRLYVQRLTAPIVLSDIDRYMPMIPTGTLAHGRRWHLTLPVTVYLR